MSLSDSIQQLYSIELFELLKKIGKIAFDNNLKAYVVGGFVRDLILKKPNYDIDIMVEGDAIPFAKNVGLELNAECKIIERFHTAHIYLNDLTIDFSSARKEIYRHPGELPEVTFSNLRDDLFRRDFTINAIALSITPDKSFEIVDLFNGVNDLKNKIIKVLHPKSFIDDPTRLYRALRFSERFKFFLDYDTDYFFDKAITQQAPKTLSIKRIAAEINKCFQENRPLTLLNKYQSSGLLSFYHKSYTQYTTPSFAFSMVKPLATRLSTKCPKISESTIFWALFLSKLPLKEALDLLINSGIPHSETMQIQSAITDYQSISQKLSNSHTRQEIYYCLKDSIPESLALILLTNKNKEIENNIYLFINELQNIKPTITGKDLIQAGIKPGPKIREIFEQIINKKLNGIELTRKDELDLARISNI